MFWFVDFVVEDFLISVVSFSELLEWLFLGDWLGGFWGDWIISSLALKSSLILLDVGLGRLGGGSRWFVVDLGLFWGFWFSRGLILVFFFLCFLQVPNV